MSKTRCANTVPTSVAHAPLRPGIFRSRTATRASSPTLPGSSAFANSPTENAEKTSVTRGRGGSIAEWITVVQASARATTERRFSAMATATHSHCTALNALPMDVRLLRRHQNRPASDASTTSPRKTRKMRLFGTRKNWLGSKSIGPLSSSAGCVFVLRTIARSSVSRCRRSARSRPSRCTSSPTPRSSDTWAGRRSPRSGSPAPCSRAPSPSSTSSPTGRPRSSHARRGRAGRTRRPGSRRRRCGLRSVSESRCSSSARSWPRRSSPGWAVTATPATSRSSTSGSRRSACRRRSSPSRARATSAVSRTCGDRWRSSSSRTSPTSCSRCCSSTSSTGGSPARPRERRSRRPGWPQPSPSSCSAPTRRRSGPAGAR